VINLGDSTDDGAKVTFQKPQKQLFSTKPSKQAAQKKLGISLPSESQTKSILKMLKRKPIGAKAVATSTSG